MLLLPSSLREWLPEDHPAYAEERGYPPYQPLLMCKLIIYGYVWGLRTLRTQRGRAHS